jgi:pimeloyl-ACP methyl ester carboxylesterase
MESTGMTATRAGSDLTAAGFAAEDIATPAGRMRVYAAGSGPALLLLHGVGGGANSYYWAWLGPILARTYRVIAPDFVGWGESEHPRRYLGFADYAAQIEALLAAQGRVAAIVAQSLAVGFALAVLKERPESAGRIIMLAPTGARDFGVDAFPPALRYTLGVLARIPGVNRAVYRSYFHRRGTAESWLRRRGFFDPAKVPQSLIEACFRSATHNGAAFSALPFVGGALRYDLAPWLEGIDRPALMLWGEHESQIAPDSRARLRSLNPRCIAHATIPASRTNFEVEQPEATADAILAFLRGA